MYQLIRTKMSFLAVEMLPANKQIFMYAAALLNADKL